MWLTEHVKDALLTSSGVALGVNVHRDSCGISEIRDLELRMIGAEADERLRGSVEVLAQEYLDHAVRSGVRQRVRQRVRPVVAADPTLRWRDLHRRLLTLIEDPAWIGSIPAAVDVTLLGRFYERFGDHAVVDRGFEVLAGGAGGGVGAGVFVGVEPDGDAVGGAWGGPVGEFASEVLTHFADGQGCEVGEDPGAGGGGVVEQGQEEVVGADPLRARAGRSGAGCPRGPSSSSG